MNNFVNMKCMKDCNLVKYNNHQGNQFVKSRGFVIYSNLLRSSSKILYSFAFVKISAIFFLLGILINITRFFFTKLRTK
jgi:hypothetical protein